MGRTARQLGWVAVTTGMGTDDDFLRAILASPGDRAPRLDYADWLDDHGQPERAEYLRVECELDALPRKDARRRRLQDRLRKLRAQVGDDWWRALDWTKVDHCVEFEFACPQRWDTLTPTPDPNVRHCAECDRSVHYCRSAREAHRLADAGQCVAIDSRQARIPLSLIRHAREAGRLLGRVAPQYPRRPALGERGPRPDPT